MKLAQRYVKFIKDAHLLWTEFLILVPACIVLYLFIPEVEYTYKLIIAGFLSSLLVIIHFGIGIYSLLKKDYGSFLNFVVLPLFAGVLFLFFTFG